MAIKELIESLEVSDVCRSLDVDVQSISHEFFRAKHAQVINASYFSLFKISSHISKVDIGLDVAI